MHQAAHSVCKAPTWELGSDCSKMAAALTGGSEASAEVGAVEPGGASRATEALSPFTSNGSLQVCLNGGVRRSNVVKIPLRFQRARWPVAGQVGWRGGLAAIDMMAGLIRTVAVETGSKEPRHTREVKSGLSD